MCICIISYFILDFGKFPFALSPVVDADKALDGLGDGEGEPAAVGAHPETGEWEDEGAEAEGLEGEDGGEGDADEPHASEGDPEGADGVAGSLHGADENHGVAEENFSCADIAEILGGEGGEFRLIGEDKAADGVGENEQAQGDYGADDSGLVSGHPTEGRGAVGSLHSEGLTDECGCGDGKTEAGHEGKGFDAEPGADGSDGDFSVGNPAQDGEEGEERGDADHGHESGGGGDPEDSFGPVETGEFDAPDFAEGGSCAEPEVDQGGDPSGNDESPGGTSEAEVCAGDDDPAKVVGGKD